MSRITATVLFLLLALLSAAPAFAASMQVDTVDCAVGWVGGPEWVVLTMGTMETRAGIADAGDFCTELIASGSFVGADKYRDWESAGYERLCLVALSNNESTVVHAWPDYESRQQGYRLCGAGQDVHYYAGADMTNPTHRAP